MKRILASEETQKRFRPARVNPARSASVRRFKNRETVELDSPRLAYQSEVEAVDDQLRRGVMPAQEHISLETLWEQQPHMMNTKMSAWHSLKSRLLNSFRRLGQKVE